MKGNSLLGAYLILSIFLFVFSSYIFLKTTPDLTKKREYIIFRIFIIAFQFYLLMNNIWTLQEHEVIRVPHGLYLAICYLSYASVAFNAFCFYAFVMSRYDYEFGKKVGATIIGVLPFSASLILLGISFVNGMIFTVTEDNHVITGPAYLALAGCSFAYFLVIIRVAIMKAIKTRTMVAKKDAFSLVFTVIFMVIWVVLDGYFDKITIIPIAIFSVILFLFISLLQSNVYTDALTQMNNRRRTEEYVSGQLENVSENFPLYIYIIDINSFKQINDNYGHAEGDAVLILFSKVVKDVVSAHAGFAARYGGDEFVISMREPKEGEIDPKIILDEIVEKIHAVCKEENKPYEISFSCGYVKCVDSQKKFSAYIKEADAIMYKNKHNFHLLHN